jgi:hypothetical protein
VPSTLVCDRRKEEDSIAAVLNASVNKLPSVAIIVNNIAAITSEAGRWKDSCLVANADTIFIPISDLAYSSSLCFYISNANSSNIERKQELYK